MVKGSLFRQFPHAREQRIIGLVLLVAVAHGLLYLCLVPPWQHYDEPGHFEHAWLLANRDEAPQPGDYDRVMRRETAASMVAHDFYRDLDGRPDLLLREKPVPVGFSQIGDPPLYYRLAALPLKLIRHTDIDTQLYAMRLVSLLLYLATVVAAYGLVAELVPPAHPLRVLVPAVVALLPAFTDLMTAANNDVGATALFSWFLWGAVRLVRRGISLPRLLWAASAAALGLWTKQSLVIAWPVLVLALCFALPARRWRRLAGGLLVAGLIGSLVVVLDWGDAARWYLTSGPVVPTRIRQTVAPTGSYAFQLVNRPGAPVPQLRQLLPRATTDRLVGQTVTVGSWIWASEPLTVRTPVLDVGGVLAFENVRVGTEPSFHAITATIAAEGGASIQLRLMPFNQGLPQSVTVFYDGLVLVEGERPPGVAPRFTDSEGRSGIWGRDPFVNLLRNPSAEVGGLRLRPWAAAMVVRYAPGQHHGVFGLFLDWQATADYYRLTAITFLQTLWARFGWAHVALPSPWYGILTLVTLIGFAGALLAVGKHSRNMPTEALVLLGVSVTGVWSAAVLRGLSSLTEPSLLIPSARYAYPAIIPTILILAAGWLYLIPKPLKSRGIMALLSGLVLLDIVSLIIVWTYYRS